MTYLINKVSFKTSKKRSTHVHAEEFMRFEPACSFQCGELLFIKHKSLLVHKCQIHNNTQHQILIWNN